MVLPQPEVVAHADWSVAPGKRWIAVARQDGDGRYRIEPPVPVGEVATLPQRLTRDGRVFLGVDLPIGVPAAWAARAGVASFPELLEAIGQGRFARFAEPAVTASEIRLERPFYPRHAAVRGAVAQHQLVQALGLADSRDLYRRCELAQPGRARASPLFWTLGAKQVGRAALDAWCRLLRPSSRDLALWPFAGDLDRLLERHPVVVGETYPADALVQLDLRLGRTGTGSKRRQDDRTQLAPSLRAVAGRLDLVLEPAMADAIASGFGPAADGEDRFDCTVGLFGMLQIVRDGRCPLPDDAPIRSVEGWILGQPA